METVADNTSVEENETVEETAPQPEETFEDYTLDDLMKLTEENDPLFSNDAQHKGMKPLNHWIQHTPEDVRKHLANIRADYTRKTQELARMRREVEDAQKKMKLQSDTIVNGALASSLKNVDTTTEYDLFDPEGMKNEIQRQAQLLLKEMLQPAQEQIEIQQRKLQLEQFKVDNPEITDPEYRKPMIELLKSRPELKMEDAFFIVKAKVGSSKLQQERDQIAARKQRQREVVRKSSSGSRSTPSGTPQFKNALEAYKWHKAQQAKK
jgi:hypothetical protein